METRTKVISVELADGHAAAIKLEKQVILAGLVYSVQPHRIVVESGVAVRDQMAAVNAHLQAMEFPAVSEGDIGKIEARIEQLKASQF